LRGFGAIPQQNHYAGSPAYIQAILKWRGQAYNALLDVDVERFQLQTYLVTNIIEIDGKERFARPLIFKHCKCFLGVYRKLSEKSVQASGFGRFRFDGSTSCTKSRS